MKAQQNEVTQRVSHKYEVWCGEVIKVKVCKVIKI